MSSRFGALTMTLVNQQWLQDERAPSAHVFGNSRVSEESSGAWLPRDNAASMKVKQSSDG
jgi:hypothetical protein